MRAPQALLRDRQLDRVRLQVGTNLLEPDRRRVVRLDRRREAGVERRDLPEHALDLRFFLGDGRRVSECRGAAKQCASARNNDDRRPPHLPGTRNSGRAPEQAPVRHKRGTLARLPDTRKAHPKPKATKFADSLQSTSEPFCSDSSGTEADADAVLGSRPVRAVRPNRAARIFVAIVAVLAVGVLPTAGSADRASELRSRADELRAETSALANESHAACSSSTRSNRSWQAHGHGSTSSPRRPRRCAQERLEAKRHLRTARHTLAAANRGLANRVRALYEEGETDPFSVLLGAASFDDALTRLDHVDRMAAARPADRGRGRAGRAPARTAQPRARGPRGRARAPQGGGGDRSGVAGAGASRARPRTSSSSPRSAR